MQQNIDSWIYFEHMFSQNHGPFPPIYIYMYSNNPVDGFLKKLLTDVEDERTLDIGIPSAPTIFPWSPLMPELASWFFVTKLLMPMLYIYVFCERDKHLEILASFLEKLMLLRS